MSAGTFAGTRTRSRRWGGIKVTAGFVLTLALAACGSDNATGPAPAQEIRGPDVAIGGGVGRTFVTDSAGKVTAVGIELSDAALNTLPAAPAEWTLPLPAGQAAAPWDHVSIDWNPQGHEPAPIYGVPHFDFHFYTVSTAAQQAIPGGPDTVSVPAANVPRDYASQVFSVPAMGVHWADTLAAEFHGHPFDRTFIYGFSRGHMVFVEPMITLAMLRSHPDASAPIKQPAAFQQPGLYPRSYSVRYDPAAGVTRVALDSLAMH